MSTATLPRTTRKVEKRTVDPRDHRISDLREHLDQSSKARKALAKERNRYLDLLTRIAREEGQHCEKCAGTGREITGINDEWDAAEIRDRMADDWDGFDDRFPDDCEEELCFEGFALSVPS